METYASRKLVASTACTLGMLAVLEGCGYGSYEITAGKPVLVLEENESREFITSEESGGYPHYEPVYEFIVRQCERSGEAVADDDGCVTLSTEVSEETYNEFGPGDTITFDVDLRGYSVTTG